jgi:hypothetical protein
LIGILYPGISQARLIAHQPYEKLYEDADFVAIVELRSVSDSEKQLQGYRDPALYLGKIATFEVGIVLKGNPDAKNIALLYFEYGKMSEPNGANFLDLSDAEKYHYLVFLKKGEDGKYIPVTGHYDAALSLKKILKDSLSPIKSNE